MIGDRSVIGQVAAGIADVFAALRLGRLKLLPNNMGVKGQIRPVFFYQNFADN